MPFNNSQVHSMVVEHDRSSLAEALLELSDGDEPVVGKGEKASHACTPTTVSLVKLHRHVRAFCGTMHNIDSTAPLNIAKMAALLYFVVYRKSRGKRPPPSRPAAEPSSACSR